jgi:hypothetical protein
MTNRNTMIERMREAEGKKGSGKLATAGGIESPNAMETMTSGVVREARPRSLENTAEIAGATSRSGSDATGDTSQKASARKGR